MEVLKVIVVSYIIMRPATTGVKIVLNSHFKSTGHEKGQLVQIMYLYLSSMMEINGVDRM